jgi:hypothetical protein
MSMAVFMDAFPLLPGKEDDVRRFAQEALERREEFDRSQERLRTTRDEWALQQTPMGSLWIVRFEAEDIGQAFADLGRSTDPFDVWFRERVLDTTGVDLAQPMESPPPEIIMEWSS